MNKQNFAAQSGRPQKITLPSFLCIGVAKGGTTTLFHWLKQHPSIWVPPHKEIHFFDRDNNWQRGIKWYISQFDDAADYEVIGDISPGYFEKTEVVIPRIKALFGKNLPKIILFLRDPVERAYSYWNFRCCYYGETKHFDELVDEYLSRNREFSETSTFDYFSDGFYYDRLIKWCDIFGRERMNIILTDELRDSPEDVLDELCSFLGVRICRSINVYERKNVASRPRIKWLMSILSAPPSWLRRLGQVLPPSIRRDLRQKLYELNARPIRLDPMNSEVEAKLRSLYYDDIVRTSAFIGKDLSRWINR